MSVLNNLCRQLYKSEFSSALRLRNCPWSKPKCRKSSFIAVQDQYRNYLTNPGGLSYSYKTFTSLTLTFSNRYHFRNRDLLLHSSSLNFSSKVDNDNDKTLEIEAPAKPKPADSSPLDEGKNAVGVGSKSKTATFKTEPSEKLFLSFTCKVCNGSNSYMISKQSYNHGVVIVTCSTCQSHHLIADHLNWFEDIKGENIQEILAEKGEKVRKFTSGDVKEFTLPDPDPDHQKIKIE